MHIFIPPYVIAFILLIFMTIFIGFGKSKPLRICYIVIASILATLGLIGMFLVRFLLEAALKKCLANGRLVNGTIAWIISEYDSFAIASTIITCVICLLILFHLYITRRNRNTPAWNSVSDVIFLTRIVLISVALVYSFGTINKFFDVASYIFTLAISEMLVLYIPIVIKRFVLLNEMLPTDTNGK